MRKTTYLSEKKWNEIFSKRFYVLDQGLHPNIFVRGPRKILRNNSRDGQTPGSK